MKRNLLALAVGVACVLPLAAEAAPSVYGRLNLSVDYSDLDTGAKGAPEGKSWNLNSNSSRVGVKGNEKLSDEFTAVYKMEWEVNGDAKTATELDARERYVGLKHYQWGTVRLGYIDSPLKNAEDSVDVFNDLLNLDMGKFISGQDRLANSINYVSPKFLDVFGANVTFQPGEGNPASLNGAGGASAGASADEDHFADAYSVALSYEDDSLYLSAAMNKEVRNMDAIRLNGRFKFNDVTLSGQFQTAEPSKAAGIGGTDSEDSFVLSAAVDMGKWTLRGEVLSVTEEYVGGGEDETTLIGGGIDYNFTQNTRVYGNLASGKMEFTPAGGGKGTDADAFVIGGGIETRF